MFIKLIFLIILTSLCYSQTDSLYFTPVGTGQPFTNDYEYYSGNSMYISNDIDAQSNSVIGYAIENDGKNIFITIRDKMGEIINEKIFSTSDSTLFCRPYIALSDNGNGVVAILEQFQETWQIKALKVNTSGAINENFSTLITTSELHTKLAIDISNDETIALAWIKLSPEPHSDTVFTQFFNYDFEPLTDKKVVDSTFSHYRIYKFKFDFRVDNTSALIITIGDNITTSPRHEKTQFVNFGSDYQQLSELKTRQTVGNGGIGVAAGPDTTVFVMWSHEYDQFWGYGYHFAVKMDKAGNTLEQFTKDIVDYFNFSLSASDNNLALFYHCLGSTYIHRYNFELGYESGETVYDSYRQPYNYQLSYNNSGNYTLTRSISGMDDRRKVVTHAGKDQINHAITTYYPSPKLVRFPNYLTGTALHPTGKIGLLYAHESFNEYEQKYALITDAVISNTSLQRTFSSLTNSYQQDTEPTFNDDGSLMSFLFIEYGAFRATGQSSSGTGDLFAITFPSVLYPKYFNNISVAGGNFINIFTRHHQDKGIHLFASEYDANFNLTANHVKLEGNSHYETHISHAAVTDRFGDALTVLAWSYLDSTQLNSYVKLRLFNEHFSPMDSVIYSVDAESNRFIVPQSIEFIMHDELLLVVKVSENSIDSSGNLEFWKIKLQDDGSVTKTVVPTEEKSIISCDKGKIYNDTVLLYMFRTSDNEIGGRIFDIYSGYLSEEFLFSDYLEHYNGGNFSAEYVGGKLNLFYEGTYDKNGLASQEIYKKDFKISDTPTSLHENTSHPGKFHLSENYPNPFNPSTNISFTIPEAGYVKIEVFNSLGQLVEVLKAGFFTAGEHTIKFNASNLGSGVYFYTASYNKETNSGKMLLIK